MAPVKRKGNPASGVCKRSRSTLTERRTPAEPVVRKSLDMYLASDFNRLESTGGYEQCGVFQTGSAVLCDRRGERAVRFEIRGGTGERFIEWRQYISITEDKIMHGWSKGEKCWEAVYHGGKIKIFYRTEWEIFKHFVVFDPRTTSLPFPSFVYQLGPHISKVIKDTEAMVWRYQKRIDDTLRFFCPKLSTDSLSLIWQFTINEWVASTKLTCKLMRWLNDAIEGLSWFWIKTLSTVVLKIIDLEITKINNCFGGSLQTADFKHIKLFLKDKLIDGEKENNSLNINLAAPDESKTST